MNRDPHFLGDSSQTSLQIMSGKKNMGFTLPDHHHNLPGHVIRGSVEPIASAQFRKNQFVSV
ncbi:hypothetical protein QQP08_021454 [Theobroma cacao]|nr:hypothetical protein QQP08_021454 [Theobroma cacao]